MTAYFAVIFCGVKTIAENICMQKGEEKSPFSLSEMLIMIFSDTRRKV